jgi:hypothetical protein
VKQCIECKTISAIKLAINDALQMTWTFLDGQREVITHTHKADREMKINTVELWYVEGEFGLKSGYVSLFGER